jgi:hypothetical protein
VWLIATWAILVGIILVILSFKSRAFHKKLDEVEDRVQRTVT